MNTAFRLLISTELFPWINVSVPIDRRLLGRFVVRCVAVWMLIAVTPAVCIDLWSSGSLLGRSMSSGASTTTNVSFSRIVASLAAVPALALFGVVTGVWFYSGVTLVEPGSRPPKGHLPRLHCYALCAMLLFHTLIVAASWAGLIVVGLIWLPLVILIVPMVWFGWIVYLSAWCATWTRSVMLGYFGVKATDLSAYWPALMCLVGAAVGWGVL